jgi:hypothetical protein
VDGTDGLNMVVFHAEPGSRSAELLDILGSLAAPQNRDARRGTQERIEDQ